jgi:hypothetical protein
LVYATAWKDVENTIQVKEESYEGPHNVWFLSKIISKIGKSTETGSGCLEFKKEEMWF